MNGDEENIGCFPWLWDCMTSCLASLQGPRPPVVKFRPVGAHHAPGTGDRRYPTLKPVKPEARRRVSVSEPERKFNKPGGSSTGITVSQSTGDLPSHTASEKDPLLKKPPSHSYPPTNYTRFQPPSPRGGPKI